MSAELGWEHNIDALAAHHRVLAPDMLGFGGSAKVIDFNDGRGMRIRHIARFCEVLGIESAHFVGNSMGAVNLFVDTTSESPVLPMRSMVTICGGGEIQRNEHSAALYDYDATLAGMRRIVEALFYDPSYPRRRRLRAAALRVQHRAGRVGSVGGGHGFGVRDWSRPHCRRALGHTTASTCPHSWSKGERDKLLPPGWAAEIAGQIPGARSVVVPNAGHCPQIEHPRSSTTLLLDFLAEVQER